MTATQGSGADAVKVTATVKVTVTKDGGQTPQEDGKTPPKTGDETAPFFPFVLALAAGAVVMITRKKNGFTKIRRKDQNKKLILKKDCRVSGDPFLHYRIFRFLIAQNLQGGRLRRSRQVYSFTACGKETYIKMLEWKKRFAL